VTHDLLFIGASVSTGKLSCEAQKVDAQAGGEEVLFLRPDCEKCSEQERRGEGCGMVAVDTEKAKTHPIFWICLMLRCVLDAAPSARSSGDID
jgi:hypothetical protein